MSTYVNACGRIVEGLVPPTEGSSGASVTLIEAGQTAGGAMIDPATYEIQATSSFYDASYDWTCTVEISKSAQTFTATIDTLEPTD